MYTEPIEERCYAYVPNRETSRDVFSGDARRQAKWIDQRRRPSPEMVVVGSASVSPSPDDETSRVAWSREAPAPGPPGPQRRRDGGTRAANPRARRPPGRLLPCTVVAAAWAGPRHVRASGRRRRLCAREPNPTTTTNEKGARLRAAAAAPPGTAKRKSGRAKENGGIGLPSGGQPGIPFLPCLRPPPRSSPTRERVSPPILSFFPAPAVPH